MLYLIKEDIKRYMGKNNINLWDVIKCYFYSKGVQAVILFRISNWLNKYRMKKLSILVKNYNIRITGCEIGEKCSIGEGLVLPHPNGIVIANLTKIGKNATILQQVTIGLKDPNYNNPPPILGDDVFCGAGSKILGNIKIGNKVIIGANSVVVTDIPDNCVAVGIPARIIKKNNQRV
jgi:serine O-acetyltransferase